MVKRNTVAVAVAAILGAAMRMHQAHAQEATATDADSDKLQEVVVTGLRRSLQESMDIKRDAIGVVDAITAEDIGKFPDSNLSESLQRITGISISRRNGEGALVTARGFGSEYNMVTLNGRMMPAADAFGGGGNGFDGGVNGQTRSFNFANLASESIKGIEVYKTSKADIATGGIGATLNVITARPFDNAGTVANFGVKAVTDETNRVGSDITPEVSGIYSFANDDKTWGVALTGSYQKRNSGSSMSTVNDWNIRRWTSDLSQSTTQLAPGADIENAPADGALYAIPNDIRYHFADRQRDRTNAQLTLQFRPIETLTLTSDYTYAETNLKEDRGDQTLWMNANHFNKIVFDTGQAVATPVLLQEDEGTAKDFGFEQQHREQTNTLKSLGFNVGWQPTDRFGLNADFHHSQAWSLPSDPVTGGGETLSSMAVRLPSTCTPPDSNNCTNRVVQTFYFNDIGLPLGTRTVFAQPTTSAPASGGDSNFDFSQAAMGSQYLRINYQAQDTSITQGRLDGSLDFEEQGRFQFGVETRSMQSHQLASNGQMTLGDWGVSHPGEVPADLMQAFSLTNAFKDFSTTGTPTLGFKGNADALAQWAVSQYGVWRDATQQNGVLSYNPGYNQDHVVKEDTDAAYFQYGLSPHLWSKQAHLLVGVRYEKTDVQAVSEQLLPTGLIWQDNNDFSLTQATQFTPFAKKSHYHNVLPNLDFDVAVTDSVKARFSYSKSLARAQYDQLRSAISIPQQNATNGSTLNGFTPNANASNPDLKPLESDNFDLSLEWYFGPSSYVSVGLFEKRVANFIGNEVISQSLFDIRDQTAGPRAQAAAAELRARGFATDDTNLFVMMAMMENQGSFTDSNGVTWTGGAANFNGTEAQHLAFATKYDILPNADDPLYQFNVTTPVNNKKARIHGAEIAGQYFFGDSGFGLYANYTVVSGDVGFDNAGDPAVNQFALLGLSDSANAVAIYEKFGWSVRLAYNWRDQYLQNINVGCCRNPVYVEPYAQLDLSVGYSWNDHLSFSFDGLNLTGEDVRWHGRTKKEVWFVEDQSARFGLGVRYKF